MTSEEARQIVVDGIDYAAYREADSSLHDSDKNRLFGSERFSSGRVVVKPSPWAEGDFEGKIAVLLRWANALNSSNPDFAEAQSLLEGEDSVIGRVIRLSQMDGLPPLEPQEKELPRWVQFPVGLVLGLFTLLCGFASLSMLLVPNKHAPMLTVILGLVLALGCLWILAKAFRLITGRKKRGGLLSPTTLRVVSFFLLVLPIAGLFTGYYREKGAVAIFQAVMYFFGFLGLRALARKREAEGARGDRAKE
jgi:amino acid transporter